MRAVKTVITAAGNLKQAEPDSDEYILLMRALQVGVRKYIVCGTYDVLVNRRPTPCILSCGAYSVALVDVGSSCHYPSLV